MLEKVFSVGFRDNSFPYRSDGQECVANLFADLLASVYCRFGAQRLPNADLPTLVFL